MTESSAERAAIHARWVRNRNRRTDDPAYRESWYAEQCGACRFWIPLAGTMGLDYGACANPAPPFDGAIRFEHDGCDGFESSGRWTTPEQC